MTQKINPQLVTQIKIYDQHIGVKDWYGDYNPYRWVKETYFHLLWFIPTPWKNFNSGYYREGSPSSYYSSITGLGGKYIDCGGELWTKPHIEIYVAGKNIKTKYFKTYKEAIDWCQENLPNVALEV